MVPTATLPHSRTSPTNATSTICAGSCRRPLNNVSLIAHHCCLCLPARVLRQALNSFGVCICARRFKDVLSHVLAGFTLNIYTISFNMHHHSPSWYILSSETTAHIRLDALAPAIVFTIIAFCMVLFRWFSRLDYLISIAVLLSICITGIIGGGKSPPPPPPHHHQWQYCRSNIREGEGTEHLIHASSGTKRFATIARLAPPTTIKLLVPSIAGTSVSVPTSWSMLFRILRPRAKHFLGVSASRRPEPPLLAQGLESLWWWGVVLVLVEGCGRKAISAPQSQPQRPAGSLVRTEGFAKVPQSI
ncbi:hypothetical protein HBH50_060820 [Parastagonospora nodorum]|nr:hypothetical protein HBH50_060820 [Parastagonospora nodorum]